MARARRSILSTLLQGVTIVCLCAALIGSGLFVCMLPVTTQLLSQTYSQESGSSFSKAELTELAMATRDYTVGSHDISTLLDSLATLYEDSATVLPAALLTAIDELMRDLPNKSPEEIVQVLDGLSERVVLSGEAVSHLDDVHAVISAATTALIVLSVCALCGCILIGIMYKRKALGWTLTLAGGIVLVALAVLALWAAFDFDGFFTVFHSLFFAQGTWTFSADSLLIRMYPTEFWVGMGIVWVATTLIASLICLILGSAIRKRGN